MLLEDLRKKAKKYGLNYDNIIKKELEAMILKEENERKKKLKKYEIKQQLGLKGKEGRTFLVVNEFGVEYAMKTFRTNKSVENLLQEVQIQRMCSDAAIAPKIIDVDKKNKFFVMEKMDSHLTDEMNSTGGKLSELRQRELIHIFKTLDKIGVLHGDVNMLNYMIRNNKLYLIDFGMGKVITPELKKKLNCSSPNMEMSLLGFVLKLKDANADPSSYSLLKLYISEEKRKQFKI
jgi:predicted Ser/Thr protein kinase